mgnify:CR=1 FL=1
MLFNMTFIKNKELAHFYDVEINSTFGNDFINVEGINNDISLRWSPGNDVYFSDLRDDDYLNAEFIVGDQYNSLVENLGISSVIEIFGNTLYLKIYYKQVVGYI